MSCTRRSRDVARFVDLSTVNELDVVEQAPELRALHRPALLTLFRTWQGLGSARVLAEAEKMLAVGTGPGVEEDLRSRQR